MSESEKKHIPSFHDRKEILVLQTFVSNRQGNRKEPTDLPTSSKTCRSNFSICSRLTHILTEQESTDQWNKRLSATRAFSDVESINRSFTVLCFGSNLYFSPRNMLIGNLIRIHGHIGHTVISSFEKYVLDIGTILVCWGRSVRDLSLWQKYVVNREHQQNAVHSGSHSFLWKRHAA